ncbi:MAG TPA: hypothetical protein VE136_16095 [Anaerolineales bacterium]|nr:hypothetical protein [Anaerolineales bacterium]
MPAYSRVYGWPRAGEDGARPTTPGVADRKPGIGMPGLQSVEFKELEPT